MSSVDYYDLLGVSRTATEQEISVAASALLKATHPDRTGSNASGHIMDLILAARKTLTDPTSRALYDKKTTSAASSGDRESYSSASTSTGASAPPPGATPTIIDPLVGGFTAYLLDKITDRLFMQHSRFIDSSPGTMMVSPMTLHHGTHHDEDGLKWDIMPGSAPGDRVHIISQGRVVDMVSLTLDDPEGGVYYADGMVWVMFYVPAEIMLTGGVISPDVEEDLSVPVPPGSGAFTVIDVSGVKVVAVNEMVGHYLGDGDILDNMSRLLG